MNLVVASKNIAALPTLGVDLGSGNVKVVQTQQVASRIDVRSAGTFLVDHDAIQNGNVRDPKKFGKALQAKLEAWEIGPSKAVCSVPSNLAVLRWLQLPMLVGDELRQAAQYKVKRHLPFPVDSAYVEASVPDIADGDATGQSLVIAVPRSVIDSRAEALEYAGLEVVGAELEAQAILRVVERKLNEQSALWRDASLTIIDVGTNNTHMYVVQNQRLQFIRGVKFGSQRIAEAVASELRISLAEAEVLIARPDTVLNQDGLLTVRIGSNSQLIYVNNEMEKLTREFLRLMRYFRSLHPERSYAGILDKVLICGGLAGLQGFGEYLQVVLGLHVERARPFAGVVGKFSKSTFESIAYRQESYTVAMGLSLSGLQGVSIREGDQSVRREYGWTRAAA
jgi:type IV pilus assembly protein PilM